MAVISVLGNIAASNGAVPAGGPYTAPLTGTYSVPANSLVVCVATYTVQPTATPPTSEVVTSSGGLTFTDSGVLATESTVGVRMKCWVANSLTGGSATNHSFTLTRTGPGTPDGIHLMVYVISGMSRTGLSAVRGTGNANDITVNVAGTATMAQAALTTNPLIYVGAGENGGVRYPTTPDAVTNGWTANLDATFTKPALRASFNSRSSGFTGNSVTLAGTNTDRCLILVEFDSSSAGPPPVRRRYVILS